MRRVVATVLRKELTDSFRDLRSLLSALVFPLVGPMLIAAMLTFQVRSQGLEAPLEVPVEGLERAPALMAFLEEAAVELSPAPADAERAVREGELSVVLVVPDGFADDFRAGRPARVELLVDRSRPSSTATIRRLERKLQEYSAGVGSLRLLARGIDPRVARPLDVVDVDLSTAQKLAANILAMVPMFVLLSAFISGLYVATDSTAGERERQSLEPLLINPVPRAGLVVGKWLATAVFSVTGALVTLLCSLLALSRVPLREIGLEFTLGPGEVVLVFVTMLPVAFLASASQMLVASFARSFKEAQTYLSLLLFLPMLPGVFLTIKPLQSALWMMFVPVLGQQVLVTDIVRGEPFQPLDFVVATSTGMAVALAAVIATSALFERERIV